jgi:integrase
MRRVLQALHEADVVAEKPEDERFPRHFTPHSLRHTFASLLVAEGKLEYARRQLGHESIKLTCDTYGSGLPMHDTSDCLDDADSNEPVTNLG